MKSRIVNPNDVEVSELNERKTLESVSRPSKGSLQRSVENIGIVQPPVVRELDDGKYEAIIGQRRTKAAQQGGLTEMPVLVVDWDDSHSIAASIAENVTDFRERVTAKDRAHAVSALFQSEGLNPEEPKDVHAVAKKLGVHPRTIHNWMECLRDEWSGTPVSVGYADKEDVTKLSIDKVQVARRVTGGGDKGVDFLRRVKDTDLSTHEVREVGRLMQRGEKIDDAIAQVSIAKEEAVSKKRMVLRIGEELYEDLEDYAINVGTTAEKATVYAIEQLLYER